MTTSYFGYDVSNTNSTNGGPSFVRVYKDGERIAEVAINKRNPLGYIREHKGSKHKRALWEQCSQVGMTLDEFVFIFGEVKL